MLKNFGMKLSDFSLNWRARPVQAFVPNMQIARNKPAHLAHVYEELRKTVNPETGRHYENPDISKLISDPNKFEAAIMPIVEKDAAAIINKGVEIDNKAAGIEGHHNARAQEIQSKGDQILTKHEDKKDDLENEAKIKPVENGLKIDVSAKIKDNVYRISDGKAVIQDKDKVMRDSVALEVEKSTALKATKATKATKASVVRASDTLHAAKEWAIDDLKGKHKK